MRNNTFLLPFETYAKQQFKQRRPQSLYQPVSYIFQLGGKRLRPYAVWLGFQLNKQDDGYLPLAFVIELFHNFTLLHDDIMDQAKQRRSKPSVHVKFGINAGILSGDAMLIHCYRYLYENYSSEVSPILVRIFTEMGIGICEGQQLDIDFEERLELSVMEYLKMIELKTSILIGSALKMGSLAGGADAKQSDFLYEFGKNLGIAFQIQDDILDVYGTQHFGKKIGGDILQKKKTFLYTKTLELLDNQARKDQFIHLYNSNDPDKLEKVVMIFDQLDVKDHAGKIKKYYYKLAMDALSEVSHDNTDLVLFNEFAKDLIVRDK